jgi:RNA polymerase sigma-70 factor (ECF subfamily)
VGIHNDIDAELAEQAARGDAAAFSELYQRYRDRVYGFAYRMVGAQVVAEDVTQEAFLALIECPGRYQPGRGSMLTFLCAVARNHTMNYLRRNKRLVEDDFDQLVRSGESGGDDAPDPLSVLLDEELTAEVNEAISALPHLQREVIILREIEELSYEEIATATGVEVNVIKARLHRARQSLMRRLAPYAAVRGDRCHELR